ncbi:MAG: trypsin-like peptidase domain-containing protein [Aeriscardovia sp.]|nr:trypsin-like peptidase domain-containing protein [Aeriscardovia sp.]
MDTRFEEKGMTGSEMNTPEQFPIYSCMQQDSASAGSKKKKKGSAAKIVALALCCSLVGGAAGAGSTVLVSSLTKNDDAVVEKDRRDQSTMLMSKRDSSTLNVSYVEPGAEISASEIYSENVNSTVGITTSINTNYFGYQTTAAASGSGFIITSDGYIVTNYHVVEDANEIKVTTYDDESYKAELVGYDESNDIAVLKIGANGLTPVVLGNSDNMKVGDSVVAIGNPLGELTFSLTTGSISALNRKITINNTAMNLIQTDCAINSGNSGGALFNSYGEVIGITNAKYSGDSSSASVDNIGFAIPIGSVRDIITSIIEKGYIEKNYIGITVYPVSSNRSDIGLAIDSVEDDSPADIAGLKADDIITKANGVKVTDAASLTDLIAECKEGDTITLTVYRDDEILEIDVKIGVRKQSTLPEEKPEEQPKEQFDRSEWPSDKRQETPFG